HGVVRRAADAETSAAPQVERRRAAADDDPHRGGARDHRHQRKGHDRGDGGLDDLLVLRVGGVQLDVLLRVRAGGCRPRDRREPPRPQRGRRAGCRRAARMSKRILVDARTAVHYTMFAPVHAAMAGDPRVSFSLVASEEPARAREIFQEAGPHGRITTRLRATATKFDAYITSDFMWMPLLFKTCRIQMFHGVGGKYGFDAPTESMRVWQRLFFVN